MMAETAMGLIEEVRAALSWVGGAVVERPMPGVYRSAEDCGSWYSPALHAVHLGARATEAILWHELAHSQQAGVGAPPAYRRPDGSVEYAIWRSDPLEREAMAVESVGPAMRRPDWPPIAAAVEALGVAGPDRGAWVAWLVAGDIERPKPRRLGRRGRLKINAAARKLAAAAAAAEAG